MDLLGERPVLSMLDETWRIYTRHEAAAPQYIGANAVVENSTVTAGCEICGTVRNSVLGTNVIIEEGAIVEDSVLMSHVTVKAGATVRYSILDAGVTVGKNATVGEAKETAEGVAVVGADYVVADGATVPAGAMISDD